MIRTRIERLTHNAKWSTETVAALYKARRDIEISFKTIRYLLRDQSFVGTKANAVSFTHKSGRR